MRQLKTKISTSLIILCIFSLISTLIVTHWLYQAPMPQTSSCSLIVASLATFGVRTFNIQNTLLSLLSQTVVPNLIIVHLSLQSRTETISEQQVYSFLHSHFNGCANSSIVQNSIQCDNGILIIIGEDYGPATKVLGTLSLPFMDGDTCIVSVDDDTIYDPNMVKTLTSRAPDNGVIGFSCEEVPWALHLIHKFWDSNEIWWHKICGEYGWMYPFQEIVECKGWLHGYQGILYRRKFFEIDIFNMTKSMPIGCFYADDVRLAGYLWSKGIKRYVYPHFIHGGFLGIGGYTPLYHMKKNASNALSFVTNTRSNHQWPCVQYFNEFI